jgi:hypothetical protein
MSGVITGGWGYVAAAWGVSLGLLVIYAGTIARGLAVAQRAHRASDPASAPPAAGASAGKNAAGR